VNVGDLAGQLDPPQRPGRVRATFPGVVARLRHPQRDAGLLQPPASIVILQGETLGRPSRLEVQIPESGGIVVSGHAVPMADGA